MQQPELEVHPAVPSLTTQKAPRRITKNPGDARSVHSGQPLNTTIRAKSPHDRSAPDRIRGKDSATGSHAWEATRNAYRRLQHTLHRPGSH